MRHLFLILLLIVTFFACKEDNAFYQTSSLNIINATVGAGPMKVNHSDSSIPWSSYGPTLAYGSAKLYGIKPGDSPITIVRSDDTTKTIFDSIVPTVRGGIYSLYLTGTVANPESVISKDELFAYSYPDADSALNIRFINLSPNSTPVKVALAGSLSTAEFDNVAYKQQTDFKKYEAKSNHKSPYFNFRVMNAEGDSLSTLPLTDSQLNAARYHSITLVFYGSIDSTGIKAPTVTCVNNF